MKHSHSWAGLRNPWRGGLVWASVLAVAAQATGAEGCPLITLKVRAMLDPEGFVRVGRTEIKPGGIYEFSVKGYKLTGWVFSVEPAAE